MASYMPVIEFNTFFLQNNGSLLTAIGTPSPDDPTEVSVSVSVQPATTFTSQQLWVIKPDPQYVGWFYLENAHFAGYRVAKGSKTGKDSLIMVVGEEHKRYLDKQMWRVERKADRFHIINRHFADFRLVVSADGGTLSTKLGDDPAEQNWTLVPRYETKVEERYITTFDNSSGTQTQWPEFHFTMGIVVEDVKTFKGYGVFDKAAENALFSTVLSGCVVYDIFSELKTQLWRYEKHVDDPSAWCKEMKVPFTAWAGKAFKLFQFVAVLKGKIAGDNCEVLGPWKVYEL